MLLGFGERHYYTVFKLYIQQYFGQYITVLTGLNASDIFDNLLTIFKSHDVPSLLKDDLRTFCRQNTQSYTEFATILLQLASRTVAETHLQLTTSESDEYASDKCLDYLPQFTASDCKKLFEHQRASALRSYKKFYSYDGAVNTIFQIELFVKPQAATYSIPSELYVTLTSDNSLQNSVML